MLRNPYLKPSKRPREVDHSENETPAVISKSVGHEPPRDGPPAPEGESPVRIPPPSNSAILDHSAEHGAGTCVSGAPDDSFDTDIDWDAAVAQADALEHRRQANEASQPFASVPGPTNEAIATVASRQPNGPQHRTAHETVASLRPPSWDPPDSNRITKPSPPSTMDHSSHADVPDIIQSLPPALQYDYPIPPPVDEEDLAHHTAYASGATVRQRLIRHAALSEPLDNGWTLFSHQKGAVLRALVRRRMVLALDMGLYVRNYVVHDPGSLSPRRRVVRRVPRQILGLTPCSSAPVRFVFRGKTLTGCVWARAFQRTFDRLKVIVICPVSLKEEWKRTAEQATSLVVQDKEPCDWTTTDVCIASWAKVPALRGTNGRKDSVVNSYVVVADEAHSMQNMAASRTQEALKLMRPPASSHCRCVGVLLLTGTPMKNGRPANLFPLLKAVRHPFGDHQRDYEIHFCAGHQQFFGTRSVWNASGASNLVQLHELISSHVLYVTKESVMKELPPKSRVMHNVPVSSKAQLQHTNALRELAKVYHAPNESNANVDKNESILGAVQRVRLVGSFAKVDATVQLATETLQKEPAVVIFTSFVEVAKLVHQRLKESGWDGHVLTGETAPKKRQAMVDDFQSGLSPVFVVTFGAGGVGLTLTAASTVILLDRPWTPGDALQAEDRVRRIGQTKPVTSIWISAFDLDQQIDAMLEQKNNTSNAVLTTGGAEAGGSAEPPKLSIFQMLRSILPNPAAWHTIVQEKDGFRQMSIMDFSQKAAIQHHPK